MTSDDVIEFLKRAEQRPGAKNSDGVFVDLPFGPESADFIKEVTAFMRTLPGKEAVVAIKAWVTAAETGVIQKTSLRCFNWALDKEPDFHVVFQRIHDDTERSRKT